MDLRKQMVKNTPSLGYSHMPTVAIPESKIKAYLNSSSMKILHQCQQNYLVKQIERRVCSQMDKTLFYLGNKHILDYVNSVKIGKNQSSMSMHRKPSNISS